jgi:TM2 domain-containing membrane protein YozV
MNAPRSDFGVTPAGHSRIAAALFALLLGGLGAHKFYLGRPGQGIFYLLFCWTFIPSIIAFIEGILYLVMDDADFAAKYG